MHMSSTSVRVTKQTKEKLQLVAKEILRIDPKLEEMYLSENYIINRMINHYLQDSPFKNG